MMIWKQRAKLVMATARWALKHPVYGIVILRSGIYTNRPNVSQLCSFISSMNSSILISVIQENKLLGSVHFFQKICLLSTNDLCFLTITCRPLMSSSLFFLFHFYIHKIIHPWPSMRKTFLCTFTFLYMTNPFSYTHQNSFSLCHTVYTQILSMFKDFLVFPTYTCGSYKSFYIYTRCSHTQEFLFTHCLALFANSPFSTFIRRPMNSLPSAIHVSSTIESGAPRIHCLALFANSLFSSFIRRPMNS